MRIQHNIMAMNAYRNYNTNTSALSKNLEKLSSGYKINRAGDDAAGLAISEKMRAQITGLNAAQKNVKDGISLVKTAEGAMQEIQDMLNRMVYLATQSANGTYDDDVDRANLQKEVDQLLSEINRIADSANFNGIKLLDGSLDTGSISGASAGVAGEVRSLVSSKVGTTLGTNTVLHVGSGGVSQAQFTIDLHGLEWTYGSTEAKTGNITIKLSNGLELTIAAGSDMATAAASGNPKTLNATEIVSYLQSNASKLSISGNVGAGKTIEWDSAASTLKIGDEEFEVSFEDTGISFKQTTYGEFKADMRVNSVTCTVAANINSTTDHNVSTTNLQSNPGEANKRLASGVAKLDKTTFTDGNEIKIGTTKFTVSADKNDKNDATKIYIGDLEDMTDKDFMQIAIERLTRAVADDDDAIFSLGYDGNTNYTVTFVEKGDIDSNYTTQNSNTDGELNQNAEDLSDEDVIKNLFQVTFSGKEPVAGKKGETLTLQIGDTSDTYNQLSVEVGNMHTTALAIDGLDITTSKSASDAISTIRDAINTVSSVRGVLGATQNRLEHTANNLSVMAENIQDAESTIRDTDVAEEMMAYTKNNILIQSAQAMLAQANAVPQGVLQLLG